MKQIFFINAILIFVCSSASAGEDRTSDAHEIKSMMRPGSSVWLRLGKSIRQGDNGRPSPYMNAVVKSITEKGVTLEYGYNIGVMAPLSTRTITVPYAEIKEAMAQDQYRRRLTSSKPIIASQTTNGSTSAAPSVPPAIYSENRIPTKHGILEKYKIPTEEGIKVQLWKNGTLRTELYELDSGAIFTTHYDAKGKETRHTSKQGGADLMTVFLTNSDGTKGAKVVSPTRPVARPAGKTIRDRSEGFARKPAAKIIVDRVRAFAQKAENAIRGH